MLSVYTIVKRAMDKRVYLSRCERVLKHSTWESLWKVRKNSIWSRDKQAWPQQTPDTFCVYIIRSPSEGVVYIGQTANLVSRLLIHRDSNYGALGKTRNNYEVGWVEVSTRKLALQLEREMIWAFEPKYNVRK